MALHRTVAGAHRGNLEDERRPYTIAAAISHRRGDDRAAYGYAMQYLEKSDSLEKAQQGVQAAELERRVRAESAAELRETRLRYRSWIAALAALLIAGAAAWALAGYRRKLRRREEQLAEQLALVDSYRESHDSLTSRLDATDAREAAVKGAARRACGRRARHRRDLLHLRRRGAPFGQDAGADAQPRDAGRRGAHGRHLQRPRRDAAAGKHFRGGPGATTTSRRSSSRDSRPRRSA